MVCSARVPSFPINTCFGFLSISGKYQKKGNQWKCFFLQRHRGSVQKNPGFVLLGQAPPHINRSRAWIGNCPIFDDGKYSKIEDKVSPPQYIKVIINFISTSSVDSWREVVVVGRRGKWLNFYRLWEGLCCGNSCFRFVPPSFLAGSPNRCEGAFLKKAEQATTRNKLIIWSKDDKRWKLIDCNQRYLIDLSQRSLQRCNHQGKLVWLLQVQRLQSLFLELGTAEALVSNSMLQTASLKPTEKNKVPFNTLNILQPCGLNQHPPPQI